MVAFQRRRVINPLNIAGDAVNGFRDVLQIIFNAFGMFHRGCAVCRTLSRNFIGKSLGVSTDTCTPSNRWASCSRPARVNRVVRSVASLLASQGRFVVVLARELRTVHPRVRDAVATDKLPQFVPVGCEGFRWFHGRFFCSPLFARSLLPRFGGGFTLGKAGAESRHLPIEGSQFLTECFERRCLTGRPQCFRGRCSCLPCPPELGIGTGA